MSTPISLDLPDGSRQVTVSCERGMFAALETLPPAGAGDLGTALLVPGYTGSKEDFISLLGPLATAGRRVLAIDMRGQHQTPGSDEPAAYEPAQLGADIAAVARATETVHLLGHSFGGLVSREAVLAGYTPRSHTLMSSGPSALPGPRAEELRTMLSFLAGTPAHELKSKIEELCHATLLPEAKQASVRPEIRAFLKNRMLSNNPTGLIAMASHLLSAEDETQALANHNIPTFVVYGEEDNAWPPATQAAMAARLGAEKVCIPGAGHNPNVEAPATTAHALTTFWNATEAGGASTARQHS